MSFVLFLRGLIGVLVVFAITTYLFTHSLWATFIQTVICAVILQIGYFAAVLVMVWRSAGKGRSAASRNETGQAAPKEDQPVGKPAQLPGVPRSPLP